MRERWMCVSAQDPFSHDADSYTTILLLYYC